jgi:hypothetical protein
MAAVPAHQNELNQIQARWQRLADDATRSLDTCYGDRFRLLRYVVQLDQTIVHQAEQLRGRFLSHEAVNIVVADVRQLQNQLRAVAMGTDERSVSMTYHPVTYQTTASGGRPKIIIAEDFLCQAVNEQRLGPAAIADLLSQLPGGQKMHERTVRRQILEYGIRESDEPTTGFTPIPDEELDDAVMVARQHQPRVGYRMLAGLFSSLGVHLPRDRVINAASQNHPPAALLEKDNFPTRQVYRCAGPMAIWHHDGQHELVNFGFVVHAFIDGYSRFILGIRCSTNNLSSTVLQLFDDISAGGMIPSRIRGDRGSENVLVAQRMVELRGAGRGSYIWGT